MTHMEANLLGVVALGDFLGYMDIDLVFHCMRFYFNMQENINYVLKTKLQSLIDSF